MWSFFCESCIPYPISDSVPPCSHPQWSNDQVPHTHVPTELVNYQHEQQQGGSLECLTGDMLHQLQSNQLSIKQFCSSMATFVVPLLLAYLNRDFPWLSGSANEQGPSPSARASVAKHVHVCLQLVESVVELMECETVANRPAQQDDKKLRVRYLLFFHLKLCVKNCSVNPKSYLWCSNYRDIVLSQFPGGRHMWLFPPLPLAFYFSFTKHSVYYCYTMYTGKV